MRWAIDCFRLTVAPARPETQIHTHMCYSEFASMIEEIARLDANPDCGLKTRAWPETRAALTNLVAAAGRRRRTAEILATAVTASRAAITALHPSQIGAPA